MCRVGARTDLPLSKSGQKQATDLAGVFAESNTHFTSAISSPLKRTWETAETILAAQPHAPLDLGSDIFLKEIDYGPDEGKPETEVIARIGAQALAAWEADMTPPDGWAVNVAEIEDGWRQIFTRYVGVPGAHLCVTSNGIARFALRLARNGANFPPKLKTGAFGVLNIDPNGTVDVLSWGVRA